MLNNQIIFAKQLNKLFDSTLKVLILGNDNSYKQFFRESLLNYKRNLSKLTKRRRLEKYDLLAESMYEQRKYLNESILGLTGPYTILSLVFDFLLLGRYFYPDKSMIIPDITSAVYLIGLMYLRSQFHKMQFKPKTALAYGLLASIGLLPILILWLIFVYRRYAKKGNIQEFDLSIEAIHRINTARNQYKEYKNIEKKLSKRQKSILKREQLSEFIKTIVFTILQFLPVKYIAGIATEINRILKLENFWIKLSGQVQSAEIRKELIEEFKKNNFNQVGKLLATPHVLYTYGLLIGTTFNLVSLFTLAKHLDRKFDVDLSKRLFRFAKQTGIRVFTSFTIIQILMLLIGIIIMFSNKTVKEVNTDVLMEESLATSNIQMLFESSNIIEQSKEIIKDAVKQFVEKLKALIKSVGNSLKQTGLFIIRNGLARAVILTNIGSFIHFYKNPIDSVTIIDELQTREKKLKKSAYKRSGMLGVSKLKIDDDESIIYMHKEYYDYKKFEYQEWLKQTDKITREIAEELLFIPLGQLTTKESRKFTEKLLAVLIASLIYGMQTLTGDKHYKPKVFYFPSVINPNAFSLFKIVGILGDPWVAWGKATLMDMAMVIAHELTHNYFQTRYTGHVILNALAEIFAVLPAALFTEMLTFTLIRFRITRTLLELYVSQSSVLMSRQHEIEADTIANYLTASSGLVLVKFYKDIKFASEIIDEEEQYIHNSLKVKAQKAIRQILRSEGHGDLAERVIAAHELPKLLKEAERKEMRNSYEKIVERFIKILDNAREIDYSEIFKDTHVFSLIKSAFAG